ncbi:MAG: NUDIX domain-containing protein [Flavipsychrobacter sp.]
MALPTRFNIRVYGIWVQDGRVLVSEETIRGNKYLKFPGGGMELGEGAIDGLKREWKEELNIEIDVLEHFYTTDFFQPSAFDSSQVISIYYWVKAKEQVSYIVNNNENEYSYWLKIADITEDTFSLPIDKIVAKRLYSTFVDN